MGIGTDIDFYNIRDIGWLQTYICVEQLKNLYQRVLERGWFRCTARFELFNENGHYHLRVSSAYTPVRHTQRRPHKFRIARVLGE